MSNNTGIPTKRREQVKRRELGRCSLCQMRGAEWHHRRSRRVIDAHRHCACNGVWLCATCHKWAHDNPEQSMPQGLVITQFETEMWTVPYLRLGSEWVLPTCDGLLALLTADQVLLEAGMPPRVFQAV